MSMPVSFRSCLQTFLKHNARQPTGQHLVASSPYIQLTHMSEPAESTFGKHEIHAKGACLLQHSGIDDFVLPRDTHDLPQPMQMEALWTVDRSALKPLRLWKDAVGKDL